MTKAKRYMFGGMLGGGASRTLGSGVAGPRAGKPSLATRAASVMTPRDATAAKPKTIAGGPPDIRGMIASGAVKPKTIAGGPPDIRGMTASGAAKPMMKKGGAVKKAKKK